jgi:hypothetical protein
MGGIPFFLDRGERLLNAGWKSKENVSFVIFPRWLRRRMNDILEGKDSEDRTIPIMAMLPSNSKNDLCTRWYPARIHLSRLLESQHF